MQLAKDQRSGNHLPRPCLVESVFAGILLRRAPTKTADGKRKRFIAQLGTDDFPKGARRAADGDCGVRQRRRYFGKFACEDVRRTCDVLGVGRVAAEGAAG